MSDDIVTRLRKSCLVVHGGIVHQIGGCTTCEAADEIERLRKQRNELAWAIAWFLKGGSQEKLAERFADYENSLDV